MQDLNTLNFLKLLPPNLKNDPETIALSAVINKFISAEIEKNRSTAIYSNINAQPHEVLDVLAVDLHVDLYDRAWSLEKKREACTNSQNWHDFKGTPQVLEDIARSIIGSAKVLEWHEYGGIRHHFKIDFNLINETLDAHTLAQLGDIVRKYKNLRAKTDGITYRSTAKGDLNVASISMVREKITVLSNDTGVTIWDLHYWGGDDEDADLFVGYWD